MCINGVKKKQQLTCGVSWIRVGAVPPCCCCTIPHAFLVRREVSHVANASIAVSPHCAVGELGDAVRHVVSGGHGSIMAHGVLLHAGLRHLRLSVGSQ